MSNKKEVKKKACSICKAPLEKQPNGKWGHGAYPIARGRCCTKCSINEVLPCRLGL